MNSTPQSNSSSQNTESSVGKTRAYSGNSAIATAELSKQKSIDITDSYNDLYFSCDSQSTYIGNQDLNRKFQHDFYSSVCLPSVHSLSLLEHISRGKVRAKRKGTIKFCNKNFAMPKVVRPIALDVNLEKKPKLNQVSISAPNSKPKKEYVRNRSSSDILLDNYSKQSSVILENHEKSKQYGRAKYADTILEGKVNYPMSIKIIKKTEVKP